MAPGRRANVLVTTPTRHKWLARKMPTSEPVDPDRPAEPGAARPAPGTPAPDAPAPSPDGGAAADLAPADPGAEAPEERGGPKGPEPTRYGDWERKGRCIDF
jgi:hypothetical protein